MGIPQQLGQPPRVTSGLDPHLVSGLISSVVALVLRNPLVCGGLPWSLVAPRHPGRPERITT